MYALQEHDHHWLVEQHAPLVKRIAYYLLARLPATVQVDDLIQSGIVGLLDAARHYDPSQGASFETYAGIRIRGAMLDEVRRLDWTPKSVYRNARRINEVVREIENREGRAARAQEIADALGVSLDEYFTMSSEVTTGRIFNFSDLFEPESGDGEDNFVGNELDPLNAKTRADFKASLARTIAGLPEREQLVLSLYYEEELNLREIGEVLGISESRVCQIHSQALLRVRARMSDWVADGERV
ncbi:RNA polymerase sigma factor FliA [Thiorhodospira sibirica]|uniref:RNA polymerase sigma factor FliA n=1 Tax=Thiorhodospira sibirica TaxID=154347 RepID=UPI00022C4C45|nr:RNA polymerase sigma factor FliA [Thiorhodospira sibirica]